MGVLLHPTSLPGPFGVGDLGPGARAFVDWLVGAGVSVWQMLPICPPGGPRDDVPYASWASLVGNPQLLSLEDLRDDGLLTAREVVPSGDDVGWAHLEQASVEKEARVDDAVERLLRDHPLRMEFERYRERSPWAVTAARFAARKRACDGAPWWAWPEDLRSANDKGPASMVPDTERILARFFLFDRQWKALRAYARSRGVGVMGDVPIYVLHDSADIWAYPEGWQLDDQGQPTAVSGAPPDMFSADGQRWGSPLYDWDRMRADEYTWWRLRLARAFEDFDAVRIDHFRAFSAYWSIPAEAPTARDGHWVPGPGQHFFEVMRSKLGPRPLYAEDLGDIDDDVRRLLADTGIPGMKILHYGFGGGADSPYLPHNIPEGSVVYPGNHDNDTSVGWFSKLEPHARAHVQHYLGVHGDDIAWDLNRAALSSTAHLAVIQMQDLLSLPTWARMNDPGSYARPPSEWRNWRWRLKPGEASAELAARLRFLGELYDRVR